MRYRFLLLLLIILPLAACSGSKAAPRHTAEEHFQKGENLFEKGMYGDAISAWEKARDTYYSPELNMLVELKIAEAYYLSERYDEAATAYADFLKQHPNDDRIAHVMYRLGLSYFQQMLSADRDQSNTENALKIFEDYLRLFPKGRDAEEIGQLIQSCQTRLAEHEVYVGRFYLRTEKFQASINRLEKVLERFPNAPVLEEAYFYLVQDYLEIGQKVKARIYLDLLSEHYPASDYVSKAQDIFPEAD